MVLTNDNEDSRRMIENCYKRHKTVVNPIIEWSDSDVWEFIRAENIPYCGLYDDGFTRLGCIGCPMAGKHGRELEFLRYPNYKKLYLKAFEELIKVLNDKNLRCSWDTPEDVFNWWMEYDILPGQLSMGDDI